MAGGRADLTGNLAAMQFQICCMRSADCLGANEQAANDNDGGAPMFDAWSS